MKVRLKVRLKSYLPLGLALAVALGACKSNGGSAQGAQVGTAFSNNTTVQPLIYSGGFDSAYLSGAAASGLDDIDDGQLMLGMVNAQRCAAGLPQLVINTKLNDAAKYHDVEMGTKNFFDHISPDGNTPGDRISGAGYEWSWIGENISGGFTTAKETFDLWWADEKNKENMLSPKFFEIGLGHVYVPGSSFKHYWTQVFAAPWLDKDRPTPPPCP